MNQKSILVTILILTVLICGCMQNSITKSSESPIIQTQSSTISPLITQTLIPGYKIYENNTLHYKLQYPQEWQIDESEKIVEIYGKKYEINTVRFNSFTISVDSYPESLNDFESRVKLAERDLPTSCDNNLISYNNTFSDITVDGIPAEERGKLH